MCVCMVAEVPVVSVLLRIVGSEARERLMGHRGNHTVVGLEKTPGRVEGLLREVTKAMTETCTQMIDKCSGRNGMTGSTLLHTSLGTLAGSLNCLHFRNSRPVLFTVIKTK